MKKEQPNNYKRQLEAMPNYIMFDGEGNYGRKQLQDHKNLKVQINLQWKEEDNIEEQNKNYETENKQILPKILNLKKSQDVEPMKVAISLEHHKRFGKYSIRYLQKTNPFGSKDAMEGDKFEVSSARYGKFYTNESDHKNLLREFDNKYCVIPFEIIIIQQQKLMRGFIIRFAFAEQVSIQSQTYLKRSYKEATVEMATNPINPYHQWFIKLDGKSIKTHQRNILAVPSPQLAACIASEFNRQKEYLSFKQMPLLMLARNAIDLDYDATNREYIEKTIIGHLEKDVVLHRKNQKSQLLQIQQQQLDPQLKLFNSKFGMDIQSNDGVQIGSLSQQNIVKIESLIRGLNNWQLVSLSSQADSLKSCILAIQLSYGQVDLDKALSLCDIENQFNKKIIENENPQESDSEDNLISINVKAAQLFSSLIYSQSILY
ncbi:unnamed protein product [Paramecium pentaurelia]|uniref:Uncharacterized protein n=1 Tax=Paramecium pentaurelia TaxID=43138 RepID=A0A8S1W7N9_9CILI|nr:unnamed protein product [Paramecium pentaurelia]